MIVGMADFFYRYGPNELGPLTVPELRTLVASGQIIPSGEIRKGRQTPWVPADSVQGLFPALETAVAGPPDAEEAQALSEEPGEPVDDLAAFQDAIEESEIEPRRIVESARYPNLRKSAAYYEGLGWLVVVVGTLGIASLFVAGAWLPKGPITFGIAAAIILSAVLTVMLVVILRSAAELIRVQIDIELNTRQTASAVFALLHGHRNRSDDSPDQ
jgi:hypothetical protein